MVDEGDWLLTISTSMISWIIDQPSTLCEQDHQLPGWTSKAAQLDEDNDNA